MERQQYVKELKRLIDQMKSHYDNFADRVQFYRDNPNQLFQMNGEMLSAMCEDTLASMKLTLETWEKEHDFYVTENGRSE